jgi:hypothetical protein
MLEFEKRLSGIAQQTILCVGDLMLDDFVYGEVGRISPEAPAPVLAVKRNEVTIGGRERLVRRLGRQRAQAQAGDLADLHALLANFGVAEELGNTLVEPGREIAVIQVDECMRVFVIDNFVGIIPLYIGAHDHEMLGFAGNVDSSGMRVALGLPIFR